jgi:hypothetical protein
MLLPADEMAIIACAKVFGLKQIEDRNTAVSKTKSELSVARPAKLGCYARLIRKYYGDELSDGPSYKWCIEADPVWRNVVDLDSKAAVEYFQVSLAIGSKAGSLPPLRQQRCTRNLRIV